ncbi:phage tail tape measure protein [Runella sp. SP2]|uniref:phage tail tape measure protein n=1 Tax=Runella sp. SP2 TaxID=2268026 RepID=UPI000F08DE4E|nr:phage tail tape measure protein [Runella sp. SP2]AYQ31461.1 phage tail tape measure protein [Runella sp. SP2]
MAKKSTETTKSIIQLVVDGKGAETSVKELGGALSYVNTELRKMKANDPKRDDLIKQKQQITAEYQKQKKEIGDIRTAWQKFKQEFATVATGVVGGNAMTFVFQQMLSYLPQVTAHSLKLKDELADVAKKTDMTDREVNKLNGSLKKMDTRTPTKELREMAGVGGQFGVAKTQIEGFVDGADKVNVALGDQFGSAEATAGAVLKLRNIFQNIKSDNIKEDMLHIGNALNVLEADGAATGAGMADFASRMGGVLIPLKVTEAQVLGLSATLEELNVTAERGSTATVDIFQRMLTETETFAKVAGIPLNDYKNLIQKDIFGAFMKYLEGLQKVVPNQIEFARVLEASKLTGSGASEVLSKLATNSDMLTEKIGKAGTALQNTDSIMAEFQKRNHSLALGLKQLSEWWNSLLYSDAAQSFVENSVKMLTSMLGLRDIAKETTAKFEAQKSTVGSLEKELVPLLNRQEQLKNMAKQLGGETKLTDEMQIELRENIKKIAEIVPEAATEFDKYGNVLDVNTEKARKAIVVQKELLKFYNKEAIKSSEKELDQVRVERQNLIAKRKAGKITSVNFMPGAGIGSTTTTEINSEDARKIDDQIADANKREIELRNRLYGLSQENKYMTAEEKRAMRNGPTPTKKSGGGSSSAGSVVSPLGADESGSSKSKKSKKPVEKGISFGDWYETVQGEIDAYADLDEKVAEERKKNLANLLKDVGVEYDTFYLSLEQKAAKGLITDEEFLKQKREKEIEELTTIKMFTELYGEETIELDRQIAQKQIEITKDAADKKVEILKEQKKAEEQVRKDIAELAKEQHKAEFDLNQAKSQMMQEGIAALMGMAKQQSGIWKALFLVQKGMAIAEIITKAQLELASYKLAIASYSAQIAATGGVSPVGWAGIATTTAQIAATKMTAAAGIATIAAQTVPVFAGREAGGAAPLTVNNGAAQGYVDRPTLFTQSAFVAGEGNRREYIVPWKMLQDPVVADMVGMIESVRPRYYSSAGDAAAAPRGIATGSGGQMLSDGLLLQVIELLSRIDSKSDKKIDFNFSTFEKTQERLNFIRKDTSA